MNIEWKNFEELRVTLLWIPKHDTHFITPNNPCMMPIFSEIYYHIIDYMKMVRASELCQATCC